MHIRSARTRKRKSAIVPGPENQPPPVRNKRARKLVDPDEYQQLVGTDHYDNDDCATYRVLRIEITKDGYITAVRVKVNKNGSLSKNEDVVFAEDVLQMASASAPPTTYIIRSK